MSDKQRAAAYAAALAEDDARIGKALHYASEYGYIDGAHHKQWVIDQMVRALTGCPLVTKTAAADEPGADPYEYQAQGESPEYLEWLGDDDGLDEWQGIAP
jgi:hypothetical protein